MITHKELRIGNRVNFEATTHIITAVGKNYSHSVWHKDKNYEYSHHEQEISGIPIDQDELNLLGMEKAGTYFKKNILYLEKYELDNGLWIATLMDSRCKIHVRYVHELQNLYFSICHQELIL